METSPTSQEVDIEIISGKYNTYEIRFENNGTFWMWIGHIIDGFGRGQDDFGSGMSRERALINARRWANETGRYYDPKRKRFPYT